jgi:molybdenum-dependent DNA-binding transcriptional regulator ModE
MSTIDIPDLTSRQLETILALAEYGSFIAAAALLKTSQPAVTRTVKHVEQVLGIKLFDRSTRSSASLISTACPTPSRRSRWEGRISWSCCRAIMN